MIISCFPFKSWPLKTRCSHTEESISRKSIKGRKPKKPLEHLPKTDKCAMICNWLENVQNEKENISYKDESDDDLSHDSDYYSEVNTKKRSFQNLHTFQLQEEKWERGYLNFNISKHNQKSIKIYENRLWRPQTTLV